MAEAVTEAQHQAAILELAQLTGWRWYHVPDSRRCPAGWPDLALWRPPRFVMAELKRDNGRLSEAQRETIGELRQCGIEVYVWRPRDWSEIERVLTCA